MASLLRRPFATTTGVYGKVLVRAENVALNNLHDVPGARKVKTRLGRGQGSSHGGQVSRVEWKE